MAARFTSRRNGHRLACLSPKSINNSRSSIFIYTLRMCARTYVEISSSDAKLFENSMATRILVEARLRKTIRIAKWKNSLLISALEISDPTKIANEDE